MSKPVDFETMKMPLSVLVPVPLREKIRMVAAAKGVPMARLVQELIEEAFTVRQAVAEEGGNEWFLVRAGRNKQEKVVCEALVEGEGGE